jgi:hypothetical protein
VRIWDWLPNWGYKRKRLDARRRLAELRARAEAKRLRVGLTEIAQMSCGIPGHAVAVGCGASVVAVSVLEGEPNPCGRCRNQRTVRHWDVEEDGTAVVREAPCPRCSSEEHPTNDG